MNYKVTSYNEKDTISLAENIESEHFPNMVICLIGDLGSGKTIFTKGFAAALEVKEEVTSPTFNIIKEYQSGQLPLYHMDVYRLDGKAEDYLNMENISNYLPEERLDIKFKLSNEAEDTRIITITPHGQAYEDLCEDVL